MMPENALDLLRPTDAIFWARSGIPISPITSRSTACCCRSGARFDQFANVRPAMLYPGVPSPLAQPGRDIDMVVVRENTEGEYAQVGGFVYHEQPEEVAIQTAVFTRRGIERVVRFAFELARKRNKKRRLTSVTKSNAQGFGMVLWDRVFRDGGGRVSRYRNRVAAGRRGRDELHPPARRASTWWSLRICSATS